MTHFRRPGLSSTLALLVPLVLLTAPAAFAKNLCLTTPEGANVFVFQGFKKPSAGKAVALRGVYYDPIGLVAPFDGSAMMRPDKTTVVAGIFVHLMTKGGGNNFTMQWVTTTALTGDAPFDSDGDFKMDGTLSLSVLDCKTVAIP
jgi:hypothetical protein